jgi:hypothetical protein
MWDLILSAVGSFLASVFSPTPDYGEGMPVKYYKARKPRSKGTGRRAS